MSYASTEDRLTDILGIKWLLVIAETVVRGKTGVHHIFVNPELILKPCLVVIIFP